MLVYPRLCASSFAMAFYPRPGTDVPHGVPPAARDARGPRGALCASARSPSARSPGGRGATEGAGEVVPEAAGITRSRPRWNMNKEWC